MRIRSVWYRIDNAWTEVFDFIFVMKWANTGWGKIIRIPFVIFICCPMSLIVLLIGGVWLVLYHLYRYATGDWKQ